MQVKILYRKNNGASPVSIDDVSSSVFWSVAGKNLQFTWFDVPAHKEFPFHSHESEQITYVLEGDLFFEAGNEIYTLSKGDCILIPSNISHRVWTEDNPVQAVDAWSPVNEKLLTNKT